MSGAAGPAARATSTKAGMRLAKDDHAGAEGARLGRPRPERGSRVRSALARMPFRPEFVGAAVPVAALVAASASPSALDGLIGFNLGLALVIACAGFGPVRFPLPDAIPGLLMLATVPRLAAMLAGATFILARSPPGEIAGRLAGAFGGSLGAGLVALAATAAAHVVLAGRIAARAAGASRQFDRRVLPAAQTAIEAALRRGAIEPAEGLRERAALAGTSVALAAAARVAVVLKGEALVVPMVAAAVAGAGFWLGGPETGAGPAPQTALQTALLAVACGLACQVPALTLALAATTALDRVADAASAPARPARTDTPRPGWSG